MWSRAGTHLNSEPSTAEPRPPANAQILSQICAGLYAPEFVTQPIVAVANMQGISEWRSLFLLVLELGKMIN